MTASNSKIVELQHRLVQRQLEIFKIYGNKDCSRMAEDVISSDKECHDITEQIAVLTQKQHELGYN